MDIYLYGCGGHSKVILDILYQQQKIVKAIVDDYPPQNLKEIYNTPIYLTSDIIHNINPAKSQWIIAIGNNTIRKKVAHQLIHLGYSFTTAIHPSSQIGFGVTINPGTVIMANSVINVDSYIGSHVIVNTGAIIDHDCYIDDYCHVAPGCSICGQVKLNQGVLLGVGSKIKPLIEIGEQTVCGAGSVVVRSLPSNCLAYGCPAKIIKFLSQ